MNLLDNAKGGSWHSSTASQGPWHSMFSKGGEMMSITRTCNTCEFAHPDGVCCSHEGVVDYGEPIVKRRQMPCWSISYHYFCILVSRLDYETRCKFLSPYSRMTIDDLFLLLD